jgi:hypothetical protein
MPARITGSMPVRFVTHGKGRCNKSGRAHVCSGLRSAIFVRLVAAWKAFGNQVSAIMKSVKPRKVDRSRAGASPRASLPTALSAQTFGHAARQGRPI